jgi:ATP-dependent protease ClpP protease subunit
MTKDDILELNELSLADVDEVYNLKLPNPDSVLDWKGLLNREIHLNYGINDYLVNIGLMIINWNREDEKLKIPINERTPIKIFINSNGGDLIPTLNLIDIITLSKTPVYTIG